MTTYGFDRSLFADMHVLVTGAGRGIGAAVAQAFLACGATVLAHSGRDLQRLQVWAERLGPEAAARLQSVAADLSREEGVEAVKAAAEQHFRGRLDVLVNNAGTMLGRVPAEETTAEHYARVADLNARQVVLLTSALIPTLRASASASIINTVSISARTGGSPGSSIYSASKAFVSTYTRSLAKELGPDGIRVNAVSPGTIETDFHQRYSSPDKLAATAKSIPLGRLGTPEDCAPAYLFLAAPSLSGYITGQVIEINGGQLLA